VAPLRLNNRIIRDLNQEFLTLLSPKASENFKGYPEKNQKSHYIQVLRSRTRAFLNKKSKAAQKIFFKRLRL